MKIKENSNITIVRLKSLTIDGIVIVKISHIYHTKPFQLEPMPQLLSGE